MNKENLEIVIEQLDTIEDAFENLRDCVYCMRKVFESELKDKEENDT